MGLEKRLIGGRVVCQHSGGLHGVSSYGGAMEGGYSVTVLCNQGDVDVQPFQDACYNYLLGQPLSYDNNWALPCGKEFSAPEMLCGDFVAHEGVPSHTIVQLKDGKLTASVKLVDHSQRVSTLRFYFRDGEAWAVKCYTRIYQKAKA